jgi:hypothetical protein
MAHEICWREKSKRLKEFGSDEFEARNILGSVYKKR